ncbi:MATE family efflux transporter [Vibrio sonorensis]|uniref:MATE family efflux transporter n=1 Tax=Vibrio sonorensis TaxID=1004316 RepID=UPI0008D92B35|nr:MATE family efflux transporter [Vibrio sonorensis]
MKKSITRQFFDYTIPTVAAMLVSGLYQVVDGIFIGRYVGADGLAGINLAWPVIATVLGVGMMIGVGTGALVSIKQGEKKPTLARQILASGIMVLLLVAPVVSGILYFGNETFLGWQNGQGRVFELGQQYLEILTFASVFTLGSIAVPFLLRNDNSPNLATLLMIVGAVLNIVLDYLFIGVWQWELRGAALATAISQCVVMLLGVGYFFSPLANERLGTQDLRFKLSAIPQIFSIGLASFFMYAYGSVMVGIHNALLVKYGSTVLVGAYAILGYIVTVYYFVAEGVASGAQPLISYQYGAKNNENVSKLLKLSMGSVVGLGIAFIVTLNLFPVELVSVFNSSDPELLAGTVTAIRLHMFALFLDGFLVVAAAYYQAIGLGRKALFVSIGNMLVQLPFLYIMPQLFGVTGIWIAYPLSNIALTLVVLVMMARDAKKHRALQLQPS